jgi:hypothetical protein
MEHLPADRSADAAPEKPPKQSSEAVHADPRSQMDAVSSTFPSVMEGDAVSRGGGGRAWISHVHGSTFCHPGPP